LRVYVESSAVLAWLLGEARGESVQKHLAEADAVFSSILTLVEVDRVLIRAQTVEEIKEGDAMDRRRVLARASRHWNLVQVHDEILERARRPFPGEPIRTLDALHMASALSIGGAVPELAVLSLDNTIRKSSMELGFEALP
jgi:predicted nucleic acid-binding protein